MASAVVLVGAGFEAAWRAIRRVPPGRVAGRIQLLLLLAVGLAIGGGLGLFVGGAHPHEMLHLVYAVVAFGTIPIATSLARNATPRARGLASLGGALVALVVVARLFGTG